MGRFLLTLLTSGRLKHVIRFNGVAISKHMMSSNYTRQ